MKIDCSDTLTDEQKAEWCVFLAQSQHQHPRQDLRFVDVMRAMGEEVLFVMGRQNGAVCAVGLFSLHPSRFLPGRIALATALSGPVCDDEDTLVDFVQNMAAHPQFAKVDAICITPYWLGEQAESLTGRLTAAGFRVTDPKPYRDTGVIDLTMSEEELQASFSRSARRKVRLVEKSEIEIRRIDTLADTETFFERLNRLVIARHNLTPVPHSEQQAGFHHIFSDPSIGIIFGAYHEENFLGGLLLYRSGKTAHARRYVADPGAAKAVGNLRVAPALWLQGLFWARREGCTQFDVEGYFPVDDKSHPNFNVYEYKREFKPDHIQRVAEHTLVLNRTSHSINTMPRRGKNAVKSILARLKQLNPKHLKRRTALKAD
ncbi:MAG: GNAT family N-acetyltransferase [Pseudomonadota bacterium]